MTPFVNPATGNTLRLEGDSYHDSIDGKIVARVVGGIPSFVDDVDDYADNFAFQWKAWENALSEDRGSNVKHTALVLGRSLLDQYDCNKKTVLECGMGGGDDTEVLLSLPFSEVHSFDISRSVERAKSFIKDPRLVISQASIYDIPYAEEQFDFVFCHRVIQHTPDPIGAIECICKKLKPGGILFVHSYKRTAIHMSEFRYKYRPYASRLPKRIVYSYVQLGGWLMHGLSSLCQRIGRLGQSFRHRFVPWYYVHKVGEYSSIGLKERVELEKLITFDALTPMYDNPLKTEELVSALNESDIEIVNLEDGLSNLVYATGIKRVRSD